MVTMLQRKTAGQKLLQRVGVVAVHLYQMHGKIHIAEFPHHLTAYTAGREQTRDDSVLAAADGDGGEIPMAVVDRLENGGALGAIGGAVGSIFDIAALIYGAVGAQKGCADLEAGVGCVGMGHGLFRQFTEFFRCHADIPPKSRAAACCRHDIANFKDLPDSATTSQDFLLYTASIHDKPAHFSRHFRRKKSGTAFFLLLKTAHYMHG